MGTNSFQSLSVLVFKTLRDVNHVSTQALLILQGYFFFNFRIHTPVHNVPRRRRKDDFSPKMTVEIFVSPDESSL